MKSETSFSREILKIDAIPACETIAASIRDTVFARLKKKGAVLGLSGGIDSSVSAALCVRALGKDRVFGLFMPEADSSGDSLRLGKLLADSLGIESIVEDISPILEALGCYRRRDESIRKIIPEYNERYRCKITLPNMLEGASYPIYSITVQSPEGETRKVRLDAESYLGIVAATNFKQRTRRMLEYYHADRLNFAVVGTPNRLEYDQGFFVKNGDGAADFKPIAHLYKTQVYQLAAALGVPEEIQRRPPTTDTYSLEQSQEEFYFSLPLDLFDLCLYGKNHSVPPQDVAKTLGLTSQQIDRIYGQIDSKRKATRYLHAKPILVEKVGEIRDGY